MRADLKEFEAAVSYCATPSFKEVREAVKHTPGLEGALKDSIEPVKTFCF